jgi:hypothetical protein
MYRSSFWDEVHCVHHFVGTDIVARIFTQRSVIKDRREGNAQNEPEYTVLHIRQESASRSHAKGRWHATLLVTDQFQAQRRDCEVANERIVKGE